MRRSHSSFRPLVVAAALLVAGLNAAFAQVAGSPPTRQQSAAETIAAAVTEASRRFGVPESWIRSVMRAESANDVDAVSRAGAIGLMQVMPATYAELRSRHGLGPDPFAIRNNVLAGTAYLREMFDRYGATGMLAAYNAGPGRWEEHLARGRALPGETVSYVARVAPMLGVDATTPISTANPAPPPSPLSAPIFVVLSSRTTAVETGSGSTATVGFEANRLQPDRASTSNSRTPAPPSERNQTQPTSAPGPTIVASAEPAGSSLFAVRRGGSER